MTDLMNINDNQVDSEPCVALPDLYAKRTVFQIEMPCGTTSKKTSLLESIQMAKSQVDVLVFSFHWGTEYQMKPLPLYSRLAPKMMEAGVDVLLGHHSHTLQPIVRYTKKSGDEGVIAYSLGNLFSDMSRKYGMYPESSKGKNERWRPPIY